MMNYEKITPFVCFGWGWGCDFAVDSPETLTVRSKIIVMNEFYNLNQIYVFKRDGKITFLLEKTHRMSVLQCIYMKKISNSAMKNKKS